MKAARLLMLLLPALLLLASCDDGGPPWSRHLTLDRMWPAEDGLSWPYAWSQTLFSSDPVTTYPAPEQVPQIPSFDRAYGLLMTDDRADGDGYDLFYELTLAGLDTTASGAIGQNLRETIYNQAGPIVTRDGRRWSPERFLRPSGRAAVPPGGAAKGPSGAPFVRIVVGPTILHGGVFEKTADHVGTYGDADQALAWLFLTGDLSVGSTFDLQLVPAYADDAWLHAQVRRRFDWMVNGRVWSDCLEVLYLVDYGVMDAAAMDLTGYYRLFKVGTIVYAPDRGPIYSRERGPIDVSLTDPHGWALHELSLLPADLPLPGSPAPEPDLANIWPNDDGDTWKYGIEAVGGDPGGGAIYPDPQDVPPLPTMAELYAWLGEAPAIAEPDDARGYLRLQFDGMKTTDSGVTAQNLAETFYQPRQVDKAGVPGDWSRRLAEVLMRARPDLREEIARRLPAAAAGAAAKALDPAEIEPLFLFGYAWEKTDSYIGTYGDLDQLLAWKFLEADLEPGHQFAHQLVPSLAGDVWLYGRVWRSLDCTVGGRTYRNCREVLYGLDMGVQVATDEQGQTAGAVRSYGAATIVYAPEVGPVLCHERISLGSSGALQDAPQGWLVDRRVELVEAEVAPVAP